MSAIWPTDNPHVKIDPFYADRETPRRPSRTPKPKKCRFCKRPTFRTVTYVPVCSECERVHRDELPDPWSKSFVDI